MGDAESYTDQSEKLILSVTRFSRAEKRFPYCLSHEVLRELFKGEQIMPRPDSGIYLIKNVVSGKFYVGSSGTLSERLRSHRRMLQGNRHDNRHLQHSWNKHGEDKFEFSVLET